METKILGGNVIETKKIERNGVPIGIVKGYIATWDIDRGDYFGQKDQFVKGAFAESIVDLKGRKRQVRFKDHHGRTVGGFPIDTVKEDDRGLYAEGEINLEVQQGREAFALAKQGVLSDFSIGFSIDEFTIKDKGDLRIIHKATIWEGSIVDEPMNPEANITELKSMPVMNLKDGQDWNEEAALDRVKEFTDSEDAPSESYKKAFAYHDGGDSYDSYKGLIADVKQGKMVLVSKALIEVAAILTESEAKGFSDVFIDYCKEAGIEIASEEKKVYVIDDVKNFTKRDLEHALIKSGCFSRKASKAIASGNLNLEDEVEEDDVFEFDVSAMLTEIKATSDSLKSDTE